VTGEKRFGHALRQKLNVQTKGLNQDFEKPQWKKYEETFFQKTGESFFPAAEPEDFSAFSSKPESPPEKYRQENRQRYDLKTVKKIHRNLLLFS
jgi:hypothetical protein